jgi:Ca2+-binding RTX toxin-like protein
MGNYGNDVIAGGADDDVIFGQLGNDSLHGDGQLVNGSLQALTSTIPASDVGGDDYVEGNGGDDLIYGGIGQDDLIGGSSSLFNLLTPGDRPDGSDTIYGGNGDLIARNDYGTAVVDEAGNAMGASHARDSDMILGDNGNIYRLVGDIDTPAGTYLSFNYDNYDAARRIIVRTAQLLDYTPGGIDYSISAEDDIGNNDIIHGESGDDFIYGMVGNDILFGDAQDDDIIGGYGYDWISGGTGQDGVLGDDGRIYTSRNSATTGEPLYGIGVVEVDNNSTTKEISTPGDIQLSQINELGQLKKTANLNPFNLDNPGEEPLFDPLYASDIIYGGLGGDFLHGGAGDDAISGAEALPAFYNNPLPQQDALRFGEDRAGEFAAYDEFNPRLRVLVDGNGSFIPVVAGQPRAGPEFLLNFDHDDAGAPLDSEGVFQTDGNDVLFGDLGNDWLVGGTGRDHIYGGRGDDLINADDNHDSNAANDIPDTAVSYEDIAYGGAGRDILIGNTGGDRLIDWAGEFNSYIVPFAPFGLMTISRSLQPGLMDYLYDLSEADGADQTLGTAFNNPNDPRNGEPNGELGLVKQQDPDWRDQTGAPADPQPGNIPGGSRDVLRAATFSSGSGNPDGFSSDIGTWSVRSGELYVAPQTLGEDAVSVFYVDALKPSYFEVSATVSIDKPTAGYKANAYLIFDYQSDTDFKFAGINDSTNKMEIGHFDGSQWIVDSETSLNIRFNQDYDLLLSINGLTATLVLENKTVISFAFQPRVDETGFIYGLNDGMVGVGTNNSRGYFDNVIVQVLPPEITFTDTDDFTDGQANRFTGLQTGNWQVNGQRYEGDLLTSLASSFMDIGLPNGLETASVLEATITFNTDSLAGFLFDAYSATDFKFVGLDIANNQVVVGHHTNGSGLVYDAAYATPLSAGMDYELGINLKGTTVAVTLNGSQVLGHVFNSLVVDGDFGVTSLGTSSFDVVSIQTDDPAFLSNSDNNAPTAVDDSATISEDSSMELDLLSNDSDPDSSSRQQ